MARRRAAAAGLLAALTVSLAGCGDSRAPVPSVFHSSRPFGFHPFVLRRYGFGLEVPGNWTDVYNQVRRPVVMIVASGAAVVAMSAYPRAFPAPADPAALAQTQHSLLAAVRARRPGVRLLRTRQLTVGGQPAVELDAIERIDGRRRRVRSLHVYGATQELVLEEYAPVATFATVDRQVFTRVSRSLRLLPVRP